MNKKFLIIAIVVLVVQASCNLPVDNPTSEILVTALPTEESSSVPATDTPAVQHQVFPANASKTTLFYDVESSLTLLKGVPLMVIHMILIAWNAHFYKI